MKIVGNYDTSGQYMEFKEPIKVAIFGSRLINEDGFTEGVKDQYGDWVNPRMMLLGLKVKLKVTEEE